MRSAELYPVRDTKYITWRLGAVALATSLALLTPAVHAQTISWATPQRDSSTPIGGEYGEVGLGAANFLNKLYVAYIGTSVVDAKGDAYVYIASNSDGGITYGNKLRVVPPSPQIAAGISNPALAVYHGRLYLGYNDGYGFANYLSSADGVNWSAISGCSGGNVDSSSPTFAVFNDTLYMGMRYKPTSSLMLCKITDTSSSYTVYSQYQLNFNPSLASFQGKLFVAYENIADSSHAIDLLTSSDGSNFTVNLGAASDQTSTAPSMAIHNSRLVIGFRTNDSQQKFLYKSTADGVNFSASIDPHWAMNGPPVLVNADSLTGSPYNGQLFMMYSSASSPTYLCSNHGQ